MSIQIGKLLHCPSTFLLCYFQEIGNQIQRKRNVRHFTICSSSRLVEVVHLVAEPSRNQIQLKKEDEKFTFVCGHSPRNLKFGHFKFTLLFWGGRRRHVLKIYSTRAAGHGSLSFCRQFFFCKSVNSILSLGNAEIKRL